MRNALIALSILTYGVAGANESLPEHYLDFSGVYRAPICTEEGSTRKFMALFRVNLLGENLLLHIDQKSMQATEYSSEKIENFQIVRVSAFSEYDEHGEHLKSEEIQNILFDSRSGHAEDRSFRWTKHGLRYRVNRTDIDKDVLGSTHDHLNVDETYALVDGNLVVRGSYHDRRVDWLFGFIPTPGWDEQTNYECTFERVQ